MIRVCPSCGASLWRLTSLKEVFPMRMVDKYFQAYGIETVGEVVDMTDARLLHVPGVGPKTVTLIRRGIARFLTARGVDGAADAY